MGWLVIGCLIIGWLATGSVLAETQVRVRLKTGGFVAGKLVNASKADHVAIQCADFADPIQLHVQSIRSVDQLERDARAELGSQIFLLSNGDSIAGQLTQLDEQSVGIDSPSLGAVRFPRGLLREFSDVNFAGRVVYAGLRSGQDWSSREKPEDWTFEAGALASSKAGATILGDVNLPDRCEVRFALSWTRSPDFVLAIGCSDAPAAGDFAAIKLEVWDGQLAMVREVGSTVELALIPNFSPENNRLNLVVHLDQVKGIAAVSTPMGKLLEKLELKSDKVLPARCIKLSNHSQQNYSSVLRLEHLEVREWDGHLPDGKQYAAGQIVTASGGVIEGELGSLDPASGELSVLKDGAETARVKMSEVRRALLKSEQAPTQEPAEAKDAAEGNEPAETKEPSEPKEPTEANDQEAKESSEPKEATEAEPQSEQYIEVELLDRSRIVGKWGVGKDGRAAIESAELEQTLSFDIAHVVSMFGNSETFKPAELPNRRGRMNTDQSELFGSLADVEAAAGTLLWLPEGAAAPVKLASTGVGRITFDTRPNQVANRTTTSPNPAAIQLGRMMGRQPAAVSRNLLRQLAIGLELRTGDVVEGKVEKIDETGVTFASPSTQATFITNEQIESVTLRPNRAAANETPQKLERLMTVPRSMKADPPTHLIVSESGDYLRGRLVSLNAQKTVVEIRLEIVELETAQIAQIYWLHDRQWTEDEKQAGDAAAAAEKDADGKDTDTEKSSETDVTPAAADKDGVGEVLQVHAIRSDSRGITFVPDQVADGKLRGKSELLGDCEVALENLQILLFGRDVGAQARELKKERWQLSLATLPKVYQESEGGVEGQSPLVGKPAPNFTLQDLEGRPHQLSKYVGRVVVLDFWASWCGPCMKTMPEVERVVTEIGDDQVDLIAVNLQESKEKAAGAMKRLEMSANVLLDVDGEVAAQYEANAIPQTVIIDRAGNVTHVFVGGGAKFVNDFTAALKSTLETK